MADELTTEEKEFFFRYFRDGEGITLLSKKRSNDVVNSVSYSPKSEFLERSNEKRIKRSIGSQVVTAKPKCPLCSQLILVLPGEDPNEKVDEHIDFGCSKEPSRTTRSESPKPLVNTKVISSPIPTKRPVGRPPKNPKISLDGKKGKEHICTVCLRKYKDVRSATHPENMSKFFAITKNYEGNLKREDVLCKPCYSSFFTKKRRDSVVLDVKSINTEHLPASPPEEEQNISNSSSDVSLATSDDSPSRRIRKCKWVGAPIEKKGGKEYYSAVELEEVTYKVGMCARFKAPGHQRSFLGRVAAFFQAGVNMHVDCVWYFFPDDTPHGSSSGEEYEVFESNLKDTNSVGTLERIAVVLTEKEFKERKEKEGMLEDDMFYCRKFYNARSKSFEPLASDEGEETTPQEEEEMIQENEIDSKN